MVQETDGTGESCRAPRGALTATVARRVPSVTAAPLVRAALAPEAPLDLSIHWIKGQRGRVALPLWTFPVGGSGRDEAERYDAKKAGAVRDGGGRHAAASIRNATPPGER